MIYVNSIVNWKWEGLYYYENGEKIHEWILQDPLGFQDAPPPPQLTGLRGRLPRQTAGLALFHSIWQKTQSEMKGDSWTPGQSSTTAGTVCRAQIGTIRIRTTYAAEQKERNWLLSGMHHLPGL
ncbi:hypothetical protein B9Z55_001374 [Caenorhabditis nigoni]|uniref:Uncharacterized protein n=1 Tax=Caenorhabditis nigoni TaxID=1611254 RepID=A0A2G5VFE4_9PELO|nr:hypothetical protein B9Z55_001374 [Caenorhabditis nigoni]